MWLTTTAGHYAVTQDPSDASRVLVGTRDRESAQGLVDGLETLCGAEVAIREREYDWHPYAMSVAREDFAQWVAFEVREYVTYADGLEAVKDSRGSGRFLDAVSRAEATMEQCTDAWMSDYNRVQRIL